MTVHPHLAGCAVLVVVERTMADMTAVLIGDYSLVPLLVHCQQCNPCHKYSPSQTIQLGQSGLVYKGSRVEHGQYLENPTFWQRGTFGSITASVRMNMLQLEFVTFGQCELEAFFTCVTLRD